MKQATIRYSRCYRPGPVSFWAHVPRAGAVSRGAAAYDPPLPGPVAGKGWPILDVEVNGVALTFSSMAEVEHVIDVLSRNPLPTTRRLSALRGAAFGPNKHWLSRLPAKAKSAKFRRVLVAYLRKASRSYAVVA